MLRADVPIMAMVGLFHGEEQNLLTGVISQIVGVAPPELFGTKVGELPDAWAPLSMAGLIPPHWGQYKDDFSESLYILGRLKPGVSIAQAFHSIL